MRGQSGQRGSISAEADLDAAFVECSAATTLDIAGVRAAADTPELWYCFAGDWTAQCHAAAAAAAGGARKRFWCCPG